MLDKRMRRVIPLVLALVAAVPQAAFAGHWYRCRYTGKTHATSCCPDGDQSADLTSSVSRAECCELRRTDPSTVNAVGPRDGEVIVPSVAVAAVSPPLDLGAREPVSATIARATSPPEPATPVYLLFSSLLL